MAKNLLEQYKNRLAVSESVYSKQHQGEKLTASKKLATAKCLENVNKFMNEAFDSSMGTQRADMGMYKKFCLNLTTVAVPNLIAHELVMVHPMSSMSGYVAYIQYTSATAKGATQPDADGNFPVYNDPFQLGNVDSTYTSASVVEPVTSFTSGTTKVAFKPVVAGTIRALDTDGNEVSDSTGTAWTASSDGTITAGSYKSGKSATDVKKIAYQYDNVVIPQDKLPTLKAKLESIPLVAHARRIAVYYSQMAVYEAKTDYGFDLGDQIADQAVGQLSYEIDTEVVELLVDTAKTNGTQTLTWSKTLPVGVSKTEHYEGFTEVLEMARAEVYKKTKKFAPNYMVCSPDVLPVLTFIKGFTSAPAGVVNGPYMAGSVNGLKVFVSPTMADGEFVIGVNGSDMMSSVAVYAPYMAIVPTQLLQMADGTTSQGFSTLYDLKVLNKNLIVRGTITL